MPIRDLFVVPFHSLYSPPYILPSECFQSGSEVFLVVPHPTQPLIVVQLYTQTSTFLTPYYNINMATIKRTTRSSKWPYTSHFEDALLTIKKRNRIEAANARILRNYRDALNARAIIEAAEYVERITKIAQFK